MTREKSEGKNDLKGINYKLIRVEPINARDFNLSETKAKNSFNLPWAAYSIRNERGQVIGFGGFFKAPKAGEEEIEFIVTYDADLSMKALNHGFVPDQAFENDGILWVHKKHLEGFVPNLQAKLDNFRQRILQKECSALDA